MFLSRERIEDMKERTTNPSECPMLRSYPIMTKHRAYAEHSLSEWDPQPGNCASRWLSLEGKDRCHCQCAEPRRASIWTFHSLQGWLILVVWCYTGCYILYPMWHAPQQYGMQVTPWHSPSYTSAGQCHLQGFFSKLLTARVSFLSTKSPVQDGSTKSKRNVHRRSQHKAISGGLNTENR